MQTIQPFLSARAAAWMYSLLLSGLMTSFVSGLTTISAAGIASATATVWINAWLTSWVVAFPALMLLAPLVRRLVGRITCDPEPQALGATRTRSINLPDTHNSTTRGG